MPMEWQQISSTIWIRIDTEKEGHPVGMVAHDKDHIVSENALYHWSVYEQGSVCSRLYPPFKGSTTSLEESIEAANEAYEKFLIREPR